MTHEDELRRLLRGGPIPAEDQQLAQVLRELRSQLASPPSEDVARDHLATITAAANEAAHEAPSVAPVGRLRRWGRRAAAAGALKIATAATVAAAASGGGLAASGNLPQPVQQQVSEVLSQVGITVPAGTEERGDAEPDDIGTTPAEPAVVDSAPPTSTPPTEVPEDDVAGEGAPADVPEEAPVEPDDEPVPFEDTPTGEPEETPSDAGRERQDDPPADDAGGAPARATDDASERSGSADAYTEHDEGPGAPDDRTE